MCSIITGYAEIAAGGDLSCSGFVMALCDGAEPVPVRDSIDPLAHTPFRSAAAPSGWWITLVYCGPAAPFPEPR